MTQRSLVAQPDGRTIAARRCLLCQASPEQQSIHRWLMFALVCSVAISCVCRGSGGWPNCAVLWPQEFFQLLTDQLLNPDFGMFEVDPDTRQLWFRCGAATIAGSR